MEPVGMLFADKTTLLKIKTQMMMPTIDKKEINEAFFSKITFLRS
jgi:hypothetical protein